MGCSGFVRRCENASDAIGGTLPASTPPAMADAARGVQRYDTLARPIQGTTMVAQRPTPVEQVSGRYSAITASSTRLGLSRIARAFATSSVPSHQATNSV